MNYKTIVLAILFTPYISESYAYDWLQVSNNANDICEQIRALKASRLRKELELLEVKEKCSKSEEKLNFLYNFINDRLVELYRRDIIIREIEEEKKEEAWANIISPIDAFEQDMYDSMYSDKDLKKYIDNSELLTQNTYISLADTIYLAIISKNIEGNVYKSLLNRCVHLTQDLIDIDCNIDELQRNYDEI